jgi:hypothetical protein
MMLHPRRSADPRRAGSNDMKRFFRNLAVAVVAILGSWAALAPARAAPPTVTPSPGYDSRLQQSRAAPVYYEPVVPYTKPVPRRRVKRTHDGAH